MISLNQKKRTKHILYNFCTSHICLYPHGPHYCVTIISFSYYWFPGVLYIQAVLNFSPATICRHNFLWMSSTSDIWYLAQSLAQASSSCLITFIKFNWNVESLTSKQRILSFFPYIRVNHLKLLLSDSFWFTKHKTTSYGSPYLKGGITLFLRFRPITFSSQDNLNPPGYWSGY